MTQSRPLFRGMDVHTDTMAVAYIAPAHGAEGPSLGTLGPRQGAMDPRLRKRPSKAPHRIVVSAAGPCGSWLSRYGTQKDSAGWAVAPALRSSKAGDRGQTHRRDAMPLARLARSGARPGGSGPQGQDDARRDLPRARADTLSALQAPQWRLKACVLRPDMRYTGRVGPGPPAGALCGRLSPPGSAPRLSSIRPGGAGAYRPPPAARTGTPRARQSLAGCPRWSRPARPGMGCHARAPCPWGPPWVP